VFAAFGGLQGLDSFGGKNIAVYGTPYPPEFVVKLWANVLGIDLDEDAYEFDERVIPWNEYEMNIPTYSDDPPDTAASTMACFIGDCPSSGPCTPREL
jgi:hypothetical protein